MSLYQKTIGKEQPLYSYHAFLFPFQWEYKTGGGRLLVSQTELADIEKAMGDGIGGWTRRESWNPPKTLVQFNEAAYFYEFVRPVLYDTGDEKTLQLHYFRETSEFHNLEYVIELPGKTYRLAVDDIVVSYYDTGVGVLAFHLLNKRQDQSAPDDILTINTKGRRVYPPFLATNTGLIGEQAFFEDADWVRGLDGTKYVAGEVPVAVRLEDDGALWIGDDFTSWTEDQRLDRTPDLIRRILPSSLFGRVRLIPVLDDRMFIVCWYGNESVVRDIQAKKRARGRRERLIDQAYKTHEWWYKYVFVDGGWKTCQNDEMTEQLLSEATYARWVRSGTLYGVNRYSFVTLTSEISSGDFNAVACSHVQTIYYKLAILSLVQRASLLRFSREVTAISDLKTKEKDIAARVSSLYQQYIRFINRVYFREVTAQEQGIELYDLLHRQMRMADQVKALESEIQELHQYALILEEEARNDKLDILTIIGAFFVVPSFVGTYFGIGEYDLSNHWLEVSVLCLLSAGLAFAVFRSRKRGPLRIVWIVLLALLMIYALFLFPNRDIWTNG